MSHGWSNVVGAIAALVLLLHLAGCAQWPTPTEVPPDAAPEEEVEVKEMVYAVSAKPRQVAPEVPAADLGALVEGNNRFALDLYHALRGPADVERPFANLLYSPYSISLALAMTYAGARGETAQQMADTLHFTLPPEQLHPAFNALDQALRSADEGDDDFVLHLVHAIWGQRGYTFREPFLDLLAQHYGAGLRILDFVAQPEPSRLTINDWASEQTEGKIEDLLPQGAIDPSTVLVLANAIYFNAAWKSPFSEEATHDAPFALLDGSQITVPTMQGTMRLRYAEGAGYQAVELPYQGERFAMLIVLPEAGGYPTFARAFDAEQLGAMVSDLQVATFELHMPKFGYGSGFELADTLGEMGMPAAFQDADFSGMDGTRNLFIDNVYHKAFISVDEAGTEAAAATAVVMARSLPERLLVDRPYIYLIRDTETGSLLFVGEVLDPSAG
jgi:serpin B